MEALPIENVDLIISQLDCVSLLLASQTCKYWHEICNSHGFIPNDWLLYCGYYGYLNIIEWALSNGHSMDTKIWLSACDGGHIDVLEWLRKNNIPFVIDENDCVQPNDNVKMFTIATKKGNLEVLQWFNKWFTGLTDMYCHEINALACEYGHIHILEWIDTLNKKYNMWPDASLISAAKGNQSKVIKWAMDKGMTSSKYYDLCMIAAYNGNLELLKWLREKNEPWDVLTCTHAILSEHIDVAKWALDNGCPQTTMSFRHNRSMIDIKPYQYSVMCAAAYIGNIDLLQYLMNRGHGFTKWTVQCAIRNKHLNAFEWMVEQGCPAYDYSCQVAAKTGDLDLLKSIYRIVGKLNKDVAKAAAMSGNLEMLEYLKSEKCVMDDGTYLSAIKKNHIHVLDWAYQNNIELTVSCFDDGALRGNLNVIKWLHDHKCPWNGTTSCYFSYSPFGDVYQWAIDNNYLVV